VVPEEPHWAQHTSNAPASKKWQKKLVYKETTQTIQAVQ
jgi:hypothetical protein